MPIAASMIGAAFVFACGPRREPIEPASGGPTSTTTSAARTGAAPASAATTTSTAPTASAAPTGTVITIPGLPIPAYGTPPRQALVGRWTVAAIDGKPIASAPAMATDPLDPTSYAAGSLVTFTASDVSFSRLGVTFAQRPYKVLSELPPIRVSIDAGFGPSNVDFLPDGSALWSLPSAPPHALSLVRSP
jgi:hypothetical protein